MYQKLISTIALFAIWSSSSLLAADLTFTTVSAQSSQSAASGVAYATQGSSVAAIQFDLKFDTTALALTATAGTAATNAGKTLSQAVQADGTLRLILAGVNAQILADGPLVNLSIQVASDACPFAYRMEIQNVIASDALGHTVSTSVHPGLVLVSTPTIIPVPNKCLVPYPVSVFRDTSDAVRMSRYGFPTLLNAGGSFGSDPTAAQSSNGNVYVAARDNANAVSANMYNASTQTWRGWQSAGGATTGTPSTAVTSTGTQWVAARSSNAYWLVSFNSSGTPGSWIPLAGVFSTDPQLTACPDGSLYVIGKDNFNALWSGHYIPGTGFQSFVLGGGVIKGTPSVSCGTDNAAYILARDNSNSNWIARVWGNSWTGWYNGGGISGMDPRIAPLGGSMGVVTIASTGSVYRNAFTEGTTNGWQSWTGVTGILTDLTPEGVNGEVYLIGPAPTTSAIWWWNQTIGWTGTGNPGVIKGSPSGAPR